MLEAGSRLNSLSGNLLEASRQFTEGLTQFVSEETKRIIGDRWAATADRQQHAGYGASFNYALVLPAERAPERIRRITEAARRLEDADPDSSSPHYARAQEHFRIGMRRLAQGLIEKAAEAFNDSERENEINFLVHLQLGKLQLYGVDEYVNIIDLAAAEKHLRAAARFARLHPVGAAVTDEFAAEAYFHAAIACYAQAGTAPVSGGNERSLFLETGLAHLARALDLNPNMPEGYYHRAKFRALLGQADLALESLRAAIKADANYCLKADVDRDFGSIRPRLMALFEELRRQAETELAGFAVSLRQFKSRNGLTVLSAKAGLAVQQLDQFLLLADGGEPRPYLVLHDALRRVKELQDSLHSFVRDGLIGDPGAARSHAAQRVAEAEAALRLAERLGLASEADAFKLREQRQFLESSQPYCADVAAETDAIRDTTFRTIEDYFRQAQSSAAGRLEKVRDEVTLAQIAEKECRGVFGGVGSIATLLGAGAGGMLGYFVGHFYGFIAFGALLALGWFTWTEGFIGRLRWRRIARRRVAEFQAVEEELALYGRLLSKSAARTLTAADFPEQLR